MSQFVLASQDASGSETEIGMPAPVSTAKIAGTSKSRRVRPAASLGALTLVSAGLSACGGDSGTSITATGSAITPKATGGAAAAAAISQADAARFLLQAQFGADDTAIAAVIAQGYSAWLDAQLAAPITETGKTWLDSVNSRAAGARDVYQNGDYMMWRHLMTGDSQVRRRLALALSEQFVISYDRIGYTWPCYMLAGYWDLLNANAFGNFRTLLEEVTLNPLVGAFLNIKGSLKETAAGRQPDENYAREVMQLFTIGLYQLNDDASYKLDISGNRVETYSLTDVSNLARVFTGYDFDYSTDTKVVSGLGLTVWSDNFTRSHMTCTVKNHSMLEANFLGAKVPANTDPAAALKIALDTLFNHTNLPPFFARSMIQRLVTSNPSPAYINRIAQVFKNNGSGVRGDLKAVWKAILTDTEARTQPTADTAGKVREPMIRIAQWGRTFNAGTTTGKWQISDVPSSLQAPFHAPSVFNFFRPGYIPPLTAMADKGMVEPEFQIHNEVSTAAWINYIVPMIQTGIYDVKANYSSLTALSVKDLLAWLNLHLSANQITAATLVVMGNALNTMVATTDAQKLTRVQAAVLLMMTCPEYLIQK